MFSVQCYNKLATLNQCISYYIISHQYSSYYRYHYLLGPLQLLSEYIVHVLK